MLQLLVLAIVSRASCAPLKADNLPQIPRHMGTNLPPTSIDEGSNRYHQHSVEENHSSEQQIGALSLMQGKVVSRHIAKSKQNQRQPEGADGEKEKGSATAPQQDGNNAEAVPAPAPAPEPAEAPTMDKARMPFFNEASVTGTCPKEAVNEKPDQFGNCECKEDYMCHFYGTQAEAVNVAKELSTEHKKEIIDIVAKEKKDEPPRCPKNAESNGPETLAMHADAGTSQRVFFKNCKWCKCKKIEVAKDHTIMKDTRLLVPLIFFNIFGLFNVLS